MGKTIHDIALEIGSGLTPLRSNDQYWSSRDFPWVKTEQLGAYHIFDANEYVSETALRETSIKVWPAKTVSIAMYGEGKTRGNSSILMIPSTTNQACCNIVADPQKADYRFLYYWLKNNYEQLRSLAAGVRKNLNADDIKGFPFPDFEVGYQSRIADALSAVDDLIENNSKLCKSLEVMAKTLYDYWFTQFDFPNAEGKPYCTSGGAMEWSQQLKSEIPKGWEVGNLYKIADYINGLACQKYRPKAREESLPVIKITEMHSGITNKTEAVSENIPDKYKIEDGDILFSWSASLEIMYWFGGKGGLNQHIFKVVPKDGFPKEYVYQQLLAYIINFIKIAEARKTTMGHITTDHLDQSRIVIPPRPVLERFSEIISPIHEMIGKYQQQNQELSKLRDWLLPMLMNGQAIVEQG